MSIKRFFKENIYIMGLSLVLVVFVLINLRINTFRYNNFDYGKFDLGNMVQMLWNTLHGRPLYLTDYFGTNLPRWAMSHVDPILLLFVPIFALYKHPLTLVFSQVLLVSLSSLLLYLISFQHLKSKPAAMLIGMSFLFYPATGFLLAWTGFHGVSVAIPFFLLAFYFFETMYLRNVYSSWLLAGFWASSIIAMSGKEEVPLYFFFFSLYIFLFRNPALGQFAVPLFVCKPVRIAVSLAILSIVWFCTAFFIVIPRFAHYRIEGYARFADSLGLDTKATRDVLLSNYFLGRYEEFGDSYQDILLNMIANPQKTILIFFGGDRLENFKMTLSPVLYLPFVAPQIFVFSLPDFMINYLTSARGIGTSEIYNHRVSMIIPVIFLSVIFGIGSLSAFSKKLIKKPHYVAVALSGVVLAANIYTSHRFNNPVWLWLNQAVGRRLSLIKVFAKTDETAANPDLKVGDVIKLSPLENKDRECARKIISLIPDNASVSGPDYLGAHLAMRETYAIFPALYNQADYVVVDVFSRKILTILDINIDVAQNVVENIIKDPNYRLETGCGNLFVFKKVGAHNKETVLPLQERYVYPEKYNLELFQGLFVSDYKVPAVLTRGKTESALFTYVRRSKKPLDEYVLFMTFVSKKTGELYQAANLPSFGISQPENWTVNRYYTERVELALPTFIDAGVYRVFIGMNNNMRTRSMYLGEVTVL